MANKNQDLKEQTYIKLKNRLINCEYTPGSTLNEAQIASEFGLSRTPVREAISRLEMDGYLKVLPKKGILVTDISLNDVLQIFQTRLEIEPITLQLAYPYLDKNELLMFRKEFEKDSSDLKNSFRMDSAMHLFIIENCRNKYLIDMMRKLFDDNTRIVIATKQNEVKIHDAKLEHLEIINSLINQDGVEKSANLMRTHIMTCKKAAMDYFYTNDYLNFTDSFSDKKYLSELKYLHLDNKQLNQSIKNDLC